MKGCGITSTVRSARWRRSRRICARNWPAWQQADSVTLDFHKWMYVQFEAGCVLVRDEAAHRRTFLLTPEYLASHGERGLAAGSHWPSEYGVQLDARFPRH